MGFISLYTAYSGLFASQVGMDTSSHNVANASTDGYSRQSVDLAARRPYQSALGLVGNGVDVNDIRRARDEFLDDRVRSSSAGLSNLTTLGGYLESLESVMGEPDAGMTDALSDIWSSFEELALDPTSNAARLNIVDLELRRPCDHCAARRGEPAGREQIVESSEARFFTQDCRYRVDGPVQRNLTVPFRRQRSSDETRVGVGNE